MASGAENAKYLDPKTLTKISRLDIIARLVVEGFVTGLHRSPYHGFSVEFAEHREYVPGDDIKHIDWKVYARSDRYYIKQYEEETNLTASILVDGSESMRFGGRSARDQVGSKLEYVQYLATALSHVIGRGQDQVGLALLDDELRETIPTRGTPSHVVHVQNSIEQLETRRSTRMAPGLRALFEQSRRRGVLLLMSDFLVDDLEETFAALRLFRHRNWEVVVLHVIEHDDPGVRRFACATAGVHARRRVRAVLAGSTREPVFRLVERKRDTRLRGGAASALRPAGHA